MAPLLPSPPERRCRNIWTPPIVPTRIAVERNGEIVPKRLYGETVLQDNDVIEVVSFVGGG